MAEERNLSPQHNKPDGALRDLVVDAGDAAIDAAISSGLLDGVPILGLISGGWKAQRSIRDRLYFKKIVNFIFQINHAAPKAKQDFLDRMIENDELSRFGENILLLIERLDCIEKSEIVGRILCAHIQGHISYNQAMRLSAIVDRCYLADLLTLRDFEPGVQGDNEEVADALFSGGLLANQGIDGGGADPDLEPGGYLYALNDYGKMLIEHGLMKVS